jgi:hypothetical protein
LLSVGVLLADALPEELDDRGAEESQQRHRRSAEAEPSAIACSR